MRGRKRKPAALKKLTRSRTKTAKQKPAFEPKAIEPSKMAAPAHLDATARKVWAELAPELGLILTRVDLAAFEIFCKLVSDERRFRETIADEGELVDGFNGARVPHPLMNQLRKVEQLIAKFGSEYGFTPASRARITVPDATREEAESDFFSDGAPPLRLAK